MARDLWAGQHDRAGFSGNGCPRRLKQDRDPSGRTGMPCGVSTGGSDAIERQDEPAPSTEPAVAGDSGGAGAANWRVRMTAREIPRATSSRSSRRRLPQVQAMRPSAPTRASKSGGAVRADGFWGCSDGKRTRTLSTWVVTWRSSRVLPMARSVRINRRYTNWRANRALRSRASSFSFSQLTRSEFATTRQLDPSSPVRLQVNTALTRRRRQGRCSSDPSRRIGRTGRDARAVAVS
jgi:hypothetical protein